MPKLRLSCWLVVLTLSLAPAAPLSAQSSEQVLRVALHDARPVTFEWEGRPSGFGVELLEHIATLEGWELVWVPSTWGQAMGQLEAGEVDLLFPMMRTPERERRFDFGNETLSPGWGRVVSRPGLTVQTLLDLEGARVGVVAQDIFGQEFETLGSALMRQPELVAFETLGEALRAAERSEVDAVAGENNSMLTQIAAYDLTPTPIVFAAGQPYMAVTKGRHGALLTRLDNRLRELKGDSNSLYYEAYDRWLGMPRPATWPIWLKGVLLTGAGLLLVSVIFSAILRTRLRARTTELVARSEALLEQIRERERAETERRVLRESLRHAQKLQLAGQLASGVAHDVRNLLTVIAAHAERVREDSPEGAEQLASLDVVERAAREAAEMTRSLVAFSRKIEARPVKVDLADFVRDTAVMVERTLPQSIELKLELPEAGAWVLADPSQVRQVVINLAVNAREAMHEGGQLTLRVEQPAPQTVRLEVCDTGRGMSQEVREQAFEPFFTTRSHEGGTGLGLATVKDIVTEQDGEIVLESGPEAGTCVRVVWPSTRPPYEVSEDGPGRGEQVLVGLVARQVRQIVSAGLLASGFEPVQAPRLSALRESLAEPGAMAALILDEGWLSDVASLLQDGLNVPSVILLLGPSGEISLPPGLPTGTERLGTSYRVSDLGLHLRRLLDAQAGAPSFAENRA